MSKQRFSNDRATCCHTCTDDLTDRNADQCCRCDRWLCHNHGYVTRSGETICPACVASPNA